MYDLRAGCVAEEEGGFGVLDWLWGFFVEGTFAARIAGFSGLSLAFEKLMYFEKPYICRNMLDCWYNCVIVVVVYRIDSSNFSVEKNNHNR